MSRPALEVADIFRDHGAAWRKANAGHVSLGQMKVMSAIEHCRTAALGGHVARCENDKCAHMVIVYNSCRNRHCPKCQGAAAKEWLAEREAELLPVGYFHVVFTLPGPIADIAYQNKAVIYHLLFKASAETVLTIAADPKHLGAHIGITAVLHTWGSTMTHHPHLHMIVPGGGISRDRQRWVSGRPRFLLPVPVLSRLFRGLFLAKLRAAHQAGHLKFFGVHAHLDDARAFKAYLAPLRKIEWYLYAKPPFGGPEAVLAYLSRYTHRVAISNRRLIASNHNGVTFRYKDYRADGRARYKVMTLGTHEFIRRQSAWRGSSLPAAENLHKRRHKHCSKTASLLDHLVGTQQNRAWQVDPDRLCSFEVEDQLVFGRLLDRQVCGLGAACDLVDVVGRSPVHGRDVRSVGQQATGVNMFPLSEHRCNPLPEREFGQSLAIAKEQRRCRQQQGAARSPRQCLIIVVGQIT